MRKQYRRRFAATLAIAAFVVFTTPRLNAQNSPDVYAIINARIVTVSGPVIERGTVVIRNGLIQAVGTSVATPPDARVIDGEGMIVYPGLIDAYTSLGIPAPAATPAVQGGGQRGQGTALLQTTSFASPNSSQPPGLQPEVLAADQIKPGGDQIDAAHSAGITTVLAVPRDGIFIGQSALINLVGDTPQQLIVKSPVALHVGFTPLRTGTYPGSLMGVFSAIRQMFLDSQRYHEAMVMYEQHPRGLKRPEQDKSLEALQPALSGEMPVVMLANSEREIIRALDLAQEFKLHAVIAGGEEAWKVADTLREQKVPVLLSLNFPKRTTAQSPDAEPESVRVLRSRVETPKGPGRLAAAHVPFAFESGAMTNMDDFIGNAVKAIENGLAQDDALRAMTLNAAQILGVDDRLGTIETGKIANLTITRGDLFEKRPRIAYVFVDGRQVELKPVTTQPGGQSRISGIWKLSINLGEGDLAASLNLTQEGEALRGSIEGALGSGQIANASAGANGEIRFTAPITLPGESKQTTEANFSGSITGNEMKGTVQIVGRSAGTFTGTRPR